MAFIEVNSLRPIARVCCSGRQGVVLQAHLNTEAHDQAKVRPGLRRKFLPSPASVSPGTDGNGIGALDREEWRWTTKV